MGLARNPLAFREFREILALLGARSESAARAVLGHHSLDVTEIYAERDARVAAEVAARLG